MIAVGLPASTADCAMWQGGDIKVNPHNVGFDTFLKEYVDEMGHQYYTPAWSFGRLMEIFDQCYEGEDGWDEWPKTGEMLEYADSLVEYIVKIYERGFERGGFDFSKLTHEKA